MIANMKAIAELATIKYGVRPVIHPHAGGYIEFVDEIEQVEADIPPVLAGFCIDTGHTFYAGMDPIDILRRYADRVDYIHFKDIDFAVFKRIMGERIRFFEACAQGVMCPIGKGVIDYPAIKDCLKRIGYQGYITVEQERDPQRRRYPFRREEKPGLPEENWVLKRCGPDPIRPRLLNRSIKRSQARTVIAIMVSVGFWHPDETKHAPSMANTFFTSCNWQYESVTEVFGSSPIRAVPSS